jgi:SAM-dependent methyltransferase
MRFDAERVKQFYSRQNEWAGVYDGDVAEAHRRNAAIVHRMSGGRVGRLLELGAGGGQNGAAVADLGFSVVAVDLTPSVARNAEKLAAQPRGGRLRVIVGDFFEVEFPDPFDVVCYWDGFGIGRDVDQRRLLERIAGWLRPTGFALIEVYSPQYWARAAGRQAGFGGAVRRYGFDVENCRMLDRWWPVGHEAQAVIQSLRCYSPDDFRRLVKGTGLAVESMEPRGAVDFDRNQFVEQVPLERAMQYLAKVIPAQ